jgi:hypothetical protein
MKRKTNEEFIDELRKLYGDEYDYSEVQYINNRVRVFLTHKVCGTRFSEIPKKLLLGKSCPKCRGDVYAKDAEDNREERGKEFVKKANIVHNGKYDYSKFIYVNTKTKGDIICPLHGVFKQTPGHHLNGCGCQECAGNVKMTANEYFERVKNLHNDEYEYIGEYNGLEKPIKLRHRLCGREFKISAAAHLYQKQGCKVCGYKRNGDRIRKTKEEFEIDARSVHGDKYEYPDEYKGKGGGKETIVCKKCGHTFKQYASAHLSKLGCPFCAHHTSYGENRLYDFLKEYDDDIQQTYKVGDKKTEIDIFLPKYKLGIEYDGLYWHSDLFKSKTFHFNKLRIANENNIDLIHIYDDEWLNKEDIVKSILLNKIHKTPHKLSAHKCEIKEITSDEFYNFMEQNHLIGGCRASIKIGLFYKGELVQAMGVRKPRQESRKNNTQWETVRSCTKCYYNVYGGLKKIWDYFIEKYDPQSIIAYADLRYSKGGLMLNRGFKLIRKTTPSYYYILHNKRVHRYHVIYDLKLPKEEIKKLRKIYDCGKLVFKYNKTN